MIAYPTQHCDLEAALKNKDPAFVGTIVSDAASVDKSSYVLPPVHFYGSKVMPITEYSSPCSAELEFSSQQVNDFERSCLEELQEFQGQKFPFSIRYYNSYYFV